MSRMQSALADEHPMPLPESFVRNPRLARLAAAARAEPEGWATYELKTGLLNQLGPRRAQAVLVDFLADHCPVEASSGPLERLSDLAQRQSVCLTHTAPDTLSLQGAPLLGGNRSPSFTVQARALFVTRLEQAITYGRSNLRAVGGSMVADIQGNEAQRYRTNWWFDPIICGRDGADMLYLRPPQASLHLAEAIDLTGAFSLGWGHCALEFVPQLLLADAVAEVPAEVPMLVDAYLPQAHYDLLRFVSPRREQIRLGFRQAARVNRLWAGTSPEYWPVLRAPGQLMRPELSSINPHGLARLLQHVPALPEPGDPALRRVFLARSGDVRLANQEEVIARLGAQGFVAVYPERLSVHEQLRLVRNATHVVGVWGSQLMLAVLFGHPDLRVLVLSGPDMEEGPSMTAVYEARGQRVLVATGHVSVPNAALPYNALCTIETELLDAALAQWL